MGVTELILAGVIGLILGAGGVAFVLVPQTEKPPDVQVIAKELTNLDLTKPVCDPQYINSHGDLLCRELTCLQFSRGIDSETSGNQCESISNIGNKIEIINTCKKEETEELRKECLELFWRRN